MAFVRNGITFMTAAEARDPNNAAAKALSGVNLGDVRFPYGFFVRDDKGKKYVEPATWADKLRILRMAFPDFPDNPSSGRRCEGNDDGMECIGSCEGAPEVQCWKTSFPDEGFFGCACVQAD
ncbi:hypothetical protein UP09_24010 [Bradyrhizobium sp. LTSP885]|uniref:hypothetical protein n=1 Tax=Bradyrhizobium sp. LTSP885 TaxID=1619232 RepID=UPI0005CA8D59|nr:hypothetical protein [Bradyrhizobium sp. LTSP885]KJC38980.1 hypothetical protein UP09_24010 [Bradyrhizobium sp. LTSP885]